jgi:hypothetical protein
MYNNSPPTLTYTILDYLSLQLGILQLLLKHLFFCLQFFLKFILRLPSSAAMYLGE